MSFLSSLFGTKPNNNDDDALAIGPAGVASLEPLGPDELALIEEFSSRSVTVPVVGRAASVLDSLIPLAAQVAQAAQTTNMAVVKFPEGVTWGDLCVRKSDGWNLLSSFKDGKFNQMAGIKQTGLQPAAIGNIALQTAAFVVGMAYMNEISGKLDALQDSVKEFQRDMERERDARLKAAYDSLARLAQKYDEYCSNPEKRTVAQQIVESAFSEAKEAWNYQIMCITDYTRELEAKKKMPADDIVGASRKLGEMENRAAAAFQLVLAAQQVGMQLDGDYTEWRIARDRQITAPMVDEFGKARSAARLNLSGKISKVGGKPLALADYVEDDYRAANPIIGLLHEGKKNAARLNPVRMRCKAEQDLAEKRGRLQDKVSTADAVSVIARDNEKALDALCFAINEADTIVYDGENLRMFKTVVPDVVQPEDSE